MQKIVYESKVNGIYKSIFDKIGVEVEKGNSKLILYFDEFSEFDLKDFFDILDILGYEVKYKRIGLRNYFSLDILKIIFGYHQQDTIEISWGKNII